MSLLHHFGFKEKLPVVSEETRRRNAILREYSNHIRVQLATLGSIQKLPVDWGFNGVPAPFSVYSYSRFTAGTLLHELDCLYTYCWNHCTFQERAAEINQVGKDLLFRDPALY